MLKHRPKRPKTHAISVRRVAQSGPIIFSIYLLPWRSPTCPAAYSELDVVPKVHLVGSHEPGPAGWRGEANVGFRGSEVSKDRCVHDI